MELSPSDQFDAAAARAILPGTGRGTTAGGGGAQASIPDLEASDLGHVPLHHPSDGPPPPVGEEFTRLVPVRPRDDGWTAQRQREFLEALAACGSVCKAAKAVGMSRESAYALRRRTDARGFAQGWDAARALAVEHLTELAWDRALEGEARPIYYHGELVGETRHYDNRLLLALIAQNRGLLAGTGVASTGLASNGLAGAGAGPALASPELIAEVAADWDAALGRVERGEALVESAGSRAAQPAVEAASETIPAPLEAETGHRGEPIHEAQHLEIGNYAHWWDYDNEQWLTNWPASDDFAGAEFWVDEEDKVLGPYDPDARPTSKLGFPIKCEWARTLTSAEEAGIEAEEAREARQRQQRRELYRRAAFGLATAAEQASLDAANGGRYRPFSIRSA